MVIKCGQLVVVKNGTVNAVPEFNDNKAVKSLYIGNHPPKTAIDRKSASVDSADLGLLDDAEPNQALKDFFDLFKCEIAAFRNADEKRQRATFKAWYASNVGSANSANTISAAIGRVRLKNGRAIFAITYFSELDTVIKDSGLSGYFQSGDGDYTKMSAVFDIEPNPQPDDLKSGIKHYLSFLKHSVNGKGAEYRTVKASVSR